MARRLPTCSHPVRSTRLSAYCAQCCYAVFMSVLWRGWQVTLVPGPHCCQWRPP